MTSTSRQLSLRRLAPFPPDNGPRSSPPLPKRRKRSNACTACKARKSKCGGTQPCNKCVATGSDCVFAVGLDRRRKYAQRRAEHDLETAQQLLDGIVQAFEAGDIAQLRELVSMVKEHRLWQDESHQTTPSGVEEGNMADEAIMSMQQPYIYPSDRRDSASSGSSVSVGSLDEANTLTDDSSSSLDGRACDMGKESEGAWMPQEETEASKLDREWQEQSLVDESIVSMSYHVDYLHIADSSPVQPRLLPPKTWAGRLVNIFFGSIAPSFPLLDEQLFVSQFNCAFTGCAPTQKWLAVLNLIFAISSRYYQLADPVAGKHVDDRIFLSRAIALTTSHNLAIEHADLHQVQIDLLLAIYYLTSGQINRSWQINGRAARAAISLNLLRPVGDHIDPVSRETRNRIWWSIFCLEHLLSGVTGRSPCLDFRAMTLYPPVPYNGEFQPPEAEALLGNTALREKGLKWTLYASESELNARNYWLETLTPSQSLYFFHLVDLSIITHTAVLAVDSLTTAKDTEQSGIRLYQEKLQAWLSSLHPPLAFTDNDNHPTVARGSQVQVSLALAYYSSQIILSRPGLIRRSDATARLNIRSKNDAAETCVSSALALISVLPDEPVLKWIVRMTPWWCILHFIMQALTVLLIQLSIGPIPSTVNQTGPGRDRSPESILDSSKKALRWLQYMGKNDSSARRAFQTSHSSIRRIAKAKELDLDGVPSAAELGDHPKRSCSADAFDPWVDSPVLGAWGGSLQFNGQAARRTSQEQLAGWHKNPVNWGPDCTVSEAEYEESPLFVWDPAFFSVDM